MINHKKTLLINTHKESISSKDQIDNVQSFVSCYLFILIFFCIIVAYDYRIFPNIEANDAILVEGPSLEKMLITEEEKERIRSKVKYQKILAEFIPKENIKLPYGPMTKLINLSWVQKLRFNFNEVFSKDTLYLKHDFQKIMQDLSLMQNNARKNNDEILINVRCKISNSTDVYNANYSRIVNLMNQFLQFRIDRNNWTFSIINSDHDIITIDVLLN